MLNKNSIQPLYKQLMDIITSQLKNGTYKPGEKIPTEPELAELYQVSRITVRRTIEELCTQGYLVKHQGKGTFVKSPMIFRKFESQKNMSFSESCRQNGRVSGSHVLAFCRKSSDSLTSDFRGLLLMKKFFSWRGFSWLTGFPLSMCTHGCQSGFFRILIRRFWKTDLFLNI